MWTDKYSPLTREDLAVHKKKVCDVSDWLDKSFRGAHGSFPILLLTGESGIGKTATIRVLAREMSASLIEWTNPVAAPPAGLTDNLSEQYFSEQRRDFEPSQSTKFSDFLLRVERYPTLDIFSSQTGTSLSCRKIILVEDIPNVFLRDAAQFRSVLRRFVRTFASGASITPAVFIVSDSGGGNSVERALFPADLRAELGVASIRFNAVAATSLAKAVARVATAEAAARGNGRGGFAMPSQESVAELIETSAGDVRAAINALQFSGLQRTSKQPAAILNGIRHSGSTSKSDVGVKRKTAGGRGKKTNSDAAADFSDAGATSGRDVNLSLFHALGKILYCKRRPAAPHAAALPAHLACHARDPLVENPEHVVDRIALSSDYFISFLHQNYVDFYASVDDVACAAEYLSDCDELASDWSTRSALSSYSSTVGARAIAFCNTSRATADAKSTTGGWRPLHKPQSVDATKRAAANQAEARVLFEANHVACGDEAMFTELLPYWCVHARLTDERFSSAAYRRDNSVAGNKSPMVLNPSQRTFLREAVGFSKRGFSTVRLQALDELAAPEQEDSLGSETVNREISEAEGGAVNRGAEMDLGNGSVEDEQNLNAGSRMLNSNENVVDEDFLIESFDDD